MVGELHTREVPLGTLDQLVRLQPHVFDGARLVNELDRSRELEQALGTGTKIVEANEQETVVVQRRALHAAHDIAAGAVLQAGDIEALRPAPAGAFLPYEEDLVVGRTAAHDMKRGAAIHPADLAPAERKEAPSC